MNERKKQKKITPGEYGLWEGCGGQYYASEARCAECGGTRAEHINLPSGLTLTKPKRSPRKPLVKKTPYTPTMFRTAGAVRVIITRMYRTTPLDRDNLLGGCKPLRDEIARQILGLDDDRESDTLQWEYKQAKGRGVLVEIYTETPKK